MTSKYGSHGQAASSLTTTQEVWKQPMPVKRTRPRKYEDSFVRQIGTAKQVGTGARGTGTPSEKRWIRFLSGIRFSAMYGAGWGEEEKGDYDDGDEGRWTLRRRATTQDGSKRATTSFLDDTSRCRSLGPYSSDPPGACLEHSRGPPQTAKEGPKGPQGDSEKFPRYPSEHDGKRCCWSR